MERLRLVFHSPVYTARKKKRIITHRWLFLLWITILSQMNMNERMNKEKKYFPNEKNFPTNE